MNPKEMTLAQAYARIRQWYSQNLPLLKQRMGERDFTKKSEALIAALPADGLNELELRAVLGEIVYGNLVWAANDKDGEATMTEYALGALAKAGFRPVINPGEQAQLTSSVLWPYLSFNK